MKRNAILFICIMACLPYGVNAASSVRMLGTNGNRGNVANGNIAAPIRGATNGMTARKASVPLTRKQVVSANPAGRTVSGGGDAIDNRLSFSPIKLNVQKAVKNNGANSAATTANAEAITELTERINGLQEQVDKDYYTKTEIDDMHDGYYTKSEIDDINDNYYTSTELDEQLAALQTKIDELNTALSTVNTETIQTLTETVTANTDRITVLEGSETTPGAKDNTVYDAGSQSRVQVSIVDEFTTGDENFVFGNNSQSSNEIETND